MGLSAARVVVGVCAAVLVAGCTGYSGPFDGYYETGADQPLETFEEALGPDNRNGLCTLEHLGGKVTYAYDTLDNVSDGNVFVDDVRLVDPIGLELVRAEVAEPRAAGDEMPAGVMAGWPDPPLNPAFEDIQWGRTRPLDGFPIKPRVDGERHYLLVLRLETDAGPKATTSAIEVEYHDEGGLAYRTYLGYRLTLRDPDSSRCF